MKRSVALVAISLMFAIGYGLIANHFVAFEMAEWPRASLKASSILVLALLAWANGARLLSAGLVFGALGDALLAVGSSSLFLAGAGAFAIGHGLYLTLFFRSGMGLAAAVNRPVRGAAMAAIIVVVGLSLALMTPPAALLVALCIYAGLLAAMTIASFTLARAHWPVIVGALMFLVSDSMLAYNLAGDDGGETPSYHFVAWITYWTAQTLICLGGLSLRMRRA